jgi:hypothetical protein
MLPFWPLKPFRVTALVLQLFTLGLAEAPPAIVPVNAIAANTAAISLRI